MLFNSLMPGFFIRPVKGHDLWSRDEMCRDG